MKLSIIALTLLFHFISCQNVSLSDQRSSVQVGNGNQFIDQLLELTKRAYGHELDPHPLPDLGFAFQTRVVFITYQGKAQLHDGILTGLTSMHRDGDCTMEYNTDGFFMDVPIGVGVLHFDYRGTVSFMKIGPSIEIAGSVAYISIHMEIEAKTGGEPELREFKILDMQGVEIRVRKRLVLSSLVQVISKIVVKLFKPSIISIVEKEVKGMVAEKLKTLKLPM